MKGVRARHELIGNALGFVEIAAAAAVDARSRIATIELDPE
jgi:hypothetical protein